MTQTFPRKHKNASDSKDEALRRNTHSSGDYVTTAENDSREDIDAPSKKDDTSNVRHDSNLQHNTDSTASTEENIPTDQHDEPIEDGTFSLGGKTTYDLTQTQTSQTRTVIRQVPNTQVIQYTPRASNSFFVFLHFFLFSLLLECNNA